jgi:hypothetical protein
LLGAAACTGIIQTFGVDVIIRKAHRNAAEDAGAVRPVRRAPFTGIVVTLGANFVWYTWRTTDSASGPTWKCRCGMVVTQSRLSPDDYRFCRSRAFGYLKTGELLRTTTTATSE